MLGQRRKVVYPLVRLHDHEVQILVLLELRFLLLDMNFEFVERVEVLRAVRYGIIGVGPFFVVFLLQDCADRVHYDNTVRVLGDDPSVRLLFLDEVSGLEY